jgi:hypothetical protein
VTIQTKHFIEVSDLLALRFACRYCDATLTLLLSDEKLSTGEHRPQTFLDNCPSCRRPWAEIAGTTYEPIIRKATVALRILQETLYGEAKAPLGFSLMVEIKPEAVPSEKK